MGGMLAAIETGFVQREIELAAYDYQKNVEAGEEIVVGVNRFQMSEEGAIPTLRIDPDVERSQVQRVQRVRAERNPEAARMALQGVEDAARLGTNLMPAIIAAVEAKSTLGEIADRMRKIFGEFTESST